jgi:hypothetical protein
LVKDKGEFSSHISRVVFGFDGPEDDTYPFEVLGDAYYIASNPPVTYYPYGGTWRDVFQELGYKEISLQAVYFLSDETDLGSQIGKNHRLEIELTFACYLETTE